MRWMELKNNRLCIVRSLLDYMSNLIRKLCKTYEIIGRNMLGNMFENMFGHHFLDPGAGKCVVPGGKQPIVTS